MKSEIREILNASVKKLYSEEINDFDITRPKFKSHGNWSSNIALILGKELKDQPRKIAKNIVIKLPLTYEGLKACSELSKKKVKTNVTLCFSVTQALMAAKCGATYVSPFIGRLDDIGESGVDLIKDIRKVFDNYKYLKTEILSASIRNVDHVKEVAKAGSDIATIPTKVFHEMYKHDLTDKGLKLFLDDWKSTNQKIS